MVRVVVTRVIAGLWSVGLGLDLGYISRPILISVWVRVKLVTPERF